MILKRKKMLQLTKEELRSHQDAKVCYNCGKRILKKLSKTTNYRKVRDHCHYAYSFSNLKFNVSNETLVVFHNCSSYGYYFIIKEVATEFEGQFECLGENTDVIDKDGNESVVIISYKKIIDRARFRATSLSNLAG